MTNEMILRTAMEQSAKDLCCEPEDFLRDENVIVRSHAGAEARKYLTLPFLCNLVYYGRRIVASVGEGCEEIVRTYLERYPPEHLFETPNLHWLDDAFAAQNGRVCFMAEYFLPDVTVLRELECPLETRLLTQKDFRELYVPAWSNALCEKRKELDVLGVGAYDADGTLAGLAACSADCETMWQIGIDVLPEFRRQGIASALTAKLAMEILKRGKVPFYCAAWSNIPSVRNAIHSGFRPAWVELTVKSREYVAEMNGCEG